MIKRMMDNKGNSTVKIECDLCGSLCEKERNVAFFDGFDSVDCIHTKQSFDLCKYCALNLLKYISAEASKKTQTRTPKHRDKVVDEMEVNKDEM